MARTVETGGPSTSSGHAMPFRPAPWAAGRPTSSRDVDDSIQLAVNTGRAISGELADGLRHLALANNEEASLRSIVELAEELRNYRSTVEFTIGLVGDSGVGKSSLINSLLDVKCLAKQGGDGASCTTVVTEYRKKRVTDTDVYNVEISCMDDGEIEGLLRQCVVDYRQYHIQDPEAALGFSEEEVLRKKAKVAWDTLTAAFENRDGCTEARFRDQAVAIEEIQRNVTAWKDDIRWPVGFNAHGVVIHSAVPEDCVRDIDHFLSGRIWPFVKVVRIYLDAEVLNNGLVLVDLPGFHDVNSARANIAERRLFQCDNIFVVTDIIRASTNAGVNQLLRQLGTNFDGLRRSQGVTIVCTKSEVSRTVESEILRDIPNTLEFNVQVTDRLWDEINDEEYDGNPTMHLKASRTNLFIAARNQHVSGLLKAHYATPSRRRKLDVYCVSNHLYDEARAEKRKMEARRRRTTNTTERILATDLQLEGSGINQLREFCQEIPSRSQIAETRHFLNTRIVDLLEKVELWRNAREASPIAQAPVEVLSELQGQLRRGFDASLTTSDNKLNEAKMSILRRPLARSANVNEWERHALSYVKTLSSWHAGTLDAFWRREGAYETEASRGYVDWNANFLTKMVESLEPIEDSFQSRSEQVFQELEESVRDDLSLLEISLNGLEGVDFFMETFHRRRRDLAYEIGHVTSAFYDKLQGIFHNLMKTHGSSYVRRHMLPTYQIIVIPGRGKRVRVIGHLSAAIRDNHNGTRLFSVMRDLFLTAINALLEETTREIRTATDRCRQDIRNDLQLLRSETPPAVDQRDLIQAASDLLEQSKTNRDHAQRAFDAGVPAM